MALVRLPRLTGLGPAQATDPLRRAGRAEEALRLGMVDYVVPTERFEEAETAAVIDVPEGAADGRESVEAADAASVRGAAGDAGGRDGPDDRGLPGLAGGGSGGAGIGSDRRAARARERGNAERKG